MLMRRRRPTRAPVGIQHVVRGCATPHSEGDAMLRRLGIRGKVLAALSVPVLVLFLLAGLLSWQALQDVRSTRAVQDVLDALEQSRLLAQAIQDERAASIEFLGPLRQAALATTDIEAVREATATALSRYRRAAREVDMESLDATTREAFAALDAQLGVLSSARSFVNAGQVAMLTVDRSYSSIAEIVSGFSGQVAATLGDRRLAAILDTSSYVTRLIEAYEHEQALGSQILAAMHAGVENDADLQAMAQIIEDHNEFRLDVSAAVSA